LLAAEIVAKVGDFAEQRAKEGYPNGVRKEVYAAEPELEVGCSGRFVLSIFYHCFAT